MRDGSDNIFVCTKTNKQKCLQVNNIYRNWYKLLRLHRLSFGRYFLEKLEAAGYTTRGFAPLAKTSAQHLWQISKDKRTPPPDRWDDWADLLDLQGADRERFMDLAAIAHLPPQARPRFLAILARLEKLEQVAAGIHASNPHGRGLHGSDRTTES